MDALHLCIALGPLSVYLLLLGVINLSKRPLVTNGARDAASLGIGLSGFVIIGPMELFLPEETAYRWGALVWLLLIALYGLSVTLFVLLMRPRLVIYNIQPDQVRPILAELVDSLDTEARWAGESLVLPQLGVQLHVETSVAMRNVQLVSTTPQQNFDGWKRIELGLSRELREVRGSKNPYGLSLIGFAVLMIAIVTLWMVNDPAAVAQSLKQMLRM